MNNYGPIHLNRDTDEVTISKKRFNALCDVAKERNEAALALKNCLDGRDAARAERDEYKAKGEKLCQQNGNLLVKIAELLAESERLRGLLRESLVKFDDYVANGDIVSPRNLLNRIRRELAATPTAKEPDRPYVKSYVITQGDDMFRADEA